MEEASSLEIVAPSHVMRETFDWSCPLQIVSTTHGRKNSSAVAIAFNCTAEIELPFDPFLTFELHRNTKLDLIRVIGNCMEPAICHRDLVFVRSGKPKHRYIVLASVDGRQMMKRYLVIDGRPHLRPDNPKHPEPTWEREMKVLRVAVGTWRNIRL